MRIKACRQPVAGAAAVQSLIVPVNYICHFARVMAVPAGMTTVEDMSFLRIHLLARLITLAPSEAFNQVMQTQFPVVLMQPPLAKSLVAAEV